MKKIVLLFFVFFVVGKGFGQIKKKDQDVDIINHEVQLGESVRMISKKYLVDPSEIYKLNKFAVDGISQGMILKVPVPKKTNVVVSETSTTPNETTSSPDETATTNGKVVDSPPITEPVKDIKKIVITERKTEVNHKVEPKETLFSLAKQFNVTVDDIKANNKEILKNGLQVGQIIVIPTEKTVDIQQSTTLTDDAPKTLDAPKKETASKEVPSEPSENKTIKHKVEPKETLFSLSRKYNVSVDEIKEQNEILLKNGLQIGQILTITTK
jgi:LysM repeat protein